MAKYTFFLISFLLFFVSCEHQNNSGYLKSIEFQSNGGTKKISGDSSFAYILILDGSEEHPSHIENDYIFNDSVKITEVVES